MILHKLSTGITASSIIITLYQGIVKIIYHMKAKFTLFLNNIITQHLISANKSLVLTCDITFMIVT